MSRSAFSSVAVAKPVIDLVVAELRCPTPFSFANDLPVHLALDLTVEEPADLRQAVAFLPPALAPRWSALDIRVHEASPKHGTGSSGGIRPKGPNKAQEDTASGSGE